jgi:hypothetical protein
MIVEYAKKFGPVVGLTIFTVWALRQTGYIQLTGY